MTTSDHKVTGMTCGDCEMSTSSDVRQVAGVQSIDVRAKTGRLTVASNAELDAAANVALPTRPATG